MAKGNPNFGKDNPYSFKKGVSGNPGGMPRLPNSLRDIKNFTQPEIQALFSKYLRLDSEGLNKALSDPKLPVIEAMIMKVIEKTLKEGDHAKFEQLLIRAGGKMKESDKESTNDALDALKEKIADLPQEQVTTYLQGVKDA